MNLTLPQCYTSLYVVVVVGILQSWLTMEYITLERKLIIFACDWRGRLWIYKHGSSIDIRSRMPQLCLVVYSDYLISWLSSGRTHPGQHSHCFSILQQQVVSIVSYCRQMTPMLQCRCCTLSSPFCTRLWSAGVDDLCLNHRWQADRTVDLSECGHRPSCECDLASVSGVGATVWTLMECQPWKEHHNKTTS